MNFENRWVLRSALNFAIDGEVVREVRREFQRKGPEKAEADLEKECLTRVKKKREEEDDRKPGRLVFLQHLIHVCTNTRMEMKARIVEQMTTIPSTTKGFAFVAKYISLRLEDFEFCSQIDNKVDGYPHMSNHMKLKRKRTAFLTMLSKLTLSFIDGLCCDQSNWKFSCFEKK
ncbi:hypothetical protein HELRODRAFT_177447 [Helobdella robusta]|uniref:Uncharacterized protein n=1 Tax=Helobdella robusta TaxID=6412 RepID=T1FBQ2_HELRO|nr:hypothetical protein HELRODRAFT_177447 [Helobdella robusta]ESN97823.1 hypothetical protein HELRODRAFT_177447 [Helobdella robusta]